MSPTQKKRFQVIGLVLVGMSVATFLLLQAMESSIEYFRTPTELKSEQPNPERMYRVAGLVRKGSVSRLDDGVTQRFDITDCENNVTVQYTGLLPDLFREGQAIVTVGKFNDEPALIASQVLAKHDENYVPNEAADAVMLAQANKCDDVDGPIEY